MFAFGHPKRLQIMHHVNHLENHAINLLRGLVHWEEARSFVASYCCSIRDSHSQSDLPDAPRLDCVPFRDPNSCAPKAVRSIIRFANQYPKVGNSLVGMLSLDPNSSHTPVVHDDYVPAAQIQRAVPTTSSAGRPPAHIGGNAFPRSPCLQCLHIILGKRPKCDFHFLGERRVLLCLTGGEASTVG